MSKARITYRFDQHHVPEVHKDTYVHRTEEPVSTHVIPMYQVEEEAVDLERLIREQLSESSALSETSATPATPVYRRTKKQVNWLGLMTAVSGAIVTGLALGIFVLSFFQEDADWLRLEQNGVINPAVTAPITDEQRMSQTEQSVMQMTDHTTDTNAQTSFTAVMQAVNIPDQSFFLVQNGVFTTIEGAQAAIDMLKANGLAAVVESAEKLTVYSGVAKDRDDALLIGGQLQASGIEVYIKPYVLSTSMALVGTDAFGAQLENYLSHSQTLLDQMVTISLQHIHEVKLTALSADQLQQLKLSHQQWTEVANSVGASATDSIQSNVQLMNTALNTALNAIEQYQKKPAASYIWQVQNAALEYLVTQKKLVEQGQLEI